jgi:hypothetical protein
MEVPAELPKLLALLPSSQCSNPCIEPSEISDKYIERQKHRDDEAGNVDDLAYEQIDRDTADRIGLLRLKPRCCR